MLAGRTRSRLALAIQDVVSAAADVESREAKARTPRRGVIARGNSALRITGVLEDDARLEEEEKAAEEKRPSEKVREWPCSNAAALARRHACVAPATALSLELRPLRSVGARPSLAAVLVLTSRPRTRPWLHLPLALPPRNAPPICHPLYPFLNALRLPSPILPALSSSQLRFPSAILPAHPSTQLRLPLAILPSTQLRLPRAILPSTQLRFPSRRGLLRPTALQGTSRRLLEAHREDVDKSAPEGEGEQERGRRVGEEGEGEPSPGSQSPSTEGPRAEIVAERQGPRKGGQKGGKGGRKGKKKKEEKEDEEGEGGEGEWGWASRCVQGTTCCETIAPMTQRRGREDAQWSGMRVT